MQTTPTKSGSVKMILPLLVLGAYWLLLINQLRIEWTVNAQYSYGWAVPFLCLYLLWRRIQNSEFRIQNSGSEAPARPSFILYLLCALLALAYAPTRLILEATPEWRVMHWALALEVLGITLCVLRLASESAIRNPQSAIGPPHPPSPTFNLRNFAFPIGFFLVAVPWLRPIEMPVIDGLTRGNVAVTIEVLNWLSVPAVQHGNVIEVSTGVVGIDEACSGIRSFQATLMISLFLGELYRLTVLRRVVLCFVGFALSFVFNVGRTGLLSWVAARDGVGAIAKWHDPAGIAILVGCFSGLWAIGVWFKHRAAGAGSAAPGVSSVSTSLLRSLSSFILHPSSLRLTPLLLALGAWFLLAEAGTEAWFRSHESRSAGDIQWNVNTKQIAQLPAAEQLSVPPANREILRYTEGCKWAWHGEDNTRWQMMYFYWSPGRIWVKSVTGHPPYGCLMALGWKLVAKQGVREFEIGNLKLGFQVYTFEANGELVQVYYCLWEEGVKVQPAFSRNFSQWERLKSALEGRRNPAIRILEIAVWGARDQHDAEVAVQRQLQDIIAVETAHSSP